MTTYSHIRVPEGDPITIQDGVLRVPERPIVAFIEGDGTGPDIWRASVRVLDASGANALGEIVADLQRRGVVVLLKGLRPEHRRLVEAVGALDALQHEAHVFDRLDDALAHARSHVHRAVAASRAPAA